eukprot:CAMPEP_0116007090 /NCGR_PEP_ID=MMETSP0321-20121206/2096_1 /TAXON_ID=163516 /ORGANISM="Leptocylindrus danicus var. danicus, Strain B650" /LENGTH=843 /DNA_ID=CAMNT_0003475727 /DNA_START=206 /DNA_END=2738 /DNA_ORIENTATION=+
MRRWSVLALLLLASCVLASVSIAADKAAVSIPHDNVHQDLELRSDILLVDTSDTGGHTEEAEESLLTEETTQDSASAPQPSWPRRIMKYGPIGRRTRLIKLLFFGSSRNLSGRDSFADIPHEEEDLSVEVPATDLYRVLVFITTAFVMGHIAIRLGMPSLVGEIVAGFLLGPPLADFVPHPEAMVLFGDIGLILLVLEAGIDIDIAQLRVTGTRAVHRIDLAARYGFGLARASGLDTDSALGVGACFSPTSLGVAVNALAPGKILNTPVGQLIIAACIIDDIIGLIILSELEALVNPSPVNFIVPIVSAVGFLLVLGWSAITWMPKFIEQKFLPIFPEDYREVAGFALMITLLMAYLPMLYYTKASYLMGAFLAGLTFSQVGMVHATFVHSTEAVMTWLIRIFFAASIGFQVPIKKFGDPYVIKWGFALYLAVASKLVLGFFVPHFEGKTMEDFPFNPHVRDIVIAGVAMTSRGEFSFIIAAFALDEGLFDGDTYAAIVFAVLLSSISSPFILLQTIKYYNRLSEKFIADSITPMPAEKDIPLYLAVQTYTGLKWGLQDHIQRCMNNLGLITIDHRHWHPRGMDADVVTELYAQDAKVKIRSPHFLSDEEGQGDVTKLSQEALIKERCEEIRQALTLAIGQPTAKVNVSQWMPHALVAHEEKTMKRSKSFWVLPEEERTKILAQEASQTLENKEVIETKVDDRPRIRLKTLSGPLTNVFKVDSAFTDTTAKISPTTEFQQFDVPATRRQRTRQTSVPNLSNPALWDTDVNSQNLAMKNVHILPAQTYSLGSNAGISTPNLRRRKQRSQMKLDIIQEDLPSVEDHLTGLVRTDLRENNDDEKQD